MGATEVGSSTTPTGERVGTLDGGADVGGVVVGDVVVGTATGEIVVGDALVGFVTVGEDVGLMVLGGQKMVSWGIPCDDDVACVI